MNLFQRIRRRLEAHPVHWVDPATGCDGWAAQYAREDNPVLHLEGQALRGLLREVNGRRVLDVGCGAGARLKAFDEQTAERVTGVDLSLNMLHEAQKRLRSANHTRLSCANLLALPFADKSFDVVLASFVLGYIEDLQTAIKELARMLSLGGILIISDFHPTASLLGWNRSYLEKRNGKIEEFCIRNYPHLHEDYFRAFQAAILKVVELCEPRIDGSVKHFFDLDNDLSLGLDDRIKFASQVARGFLNAKQ